MPLAWLKQVNRAVTGALEPDVTVLLTVPVSVGLRRARRKGADRIERERVAFHRRVAGGFLALARQAPKRFKIIPVTATVEGTAKRVREVLRGRW
jgi:dTMP kinase